MYSTYIQRIEIVLLSDPWCIQLTLNTDSRRTNTDKYSLNICTYKLYRYTNEDIVEKTKFLNNELNCDYLPDHNWKLDSKTSTCSFNLKGRETHTWSCWEIQPW